MDELQIYESLGFGSAEFGQQTQNQNAGLHWTTAAFFLVTDMSIGGMVALPAAIFRTQFRPGLALLALFTILATVSAVLLGNCWQILLCRFPEYCRNHCRTPYAEIGRRALGSKMKKFVSICVNLTQFGAATVFLLLSASNIRDFLRVLIGPAQVCLPLLLLSLFLFPLTLLKSPNDFWPLLFVGTFCTFATFILLCVGILMDLFNASKELSPKRHTIPEFNPNNYLDAMGTMLFAYGGHPAIPTVQHDMNDPTMFRKSATVGFSIMAFFNFVVVVLACSVYGNGLNGSVVASVQTEWIRQAVLGLITANSLISITLVINPLNQEAEQFFSIPQDFGWQRVLVRAFVLASIVFVSESVPNFGPALDFFGASTVTMTSLIFPFLFHLFLSSTADQNDCQNPLKNLKNVRKSVLLIYALIIAFASLVAIFATLSALQALFGARFEMPCYLRRLLSSSAGEQRG